MNEAYTEVKGLNLTEWDLQLENGVLMRLDDTMHTSYSFFPSSHIKKEVPLKFYQLPIQNYKLECENEPGEDGRTLFNLLKKHSFNSFSASDGVNNVLMQIQ